MTRPTLAAPEVWLFGDTETTGLVPTAPNATILELGLLAVEVPSFREVDAWSSVVVAPGRASDVLAGADDYVRNMHTASGLKAELEAALRPAASGGAIPDLASVQAKAIQFFLKHCAGRKAYLGGANPSFDQDWLRVHMPQLIGKFHYRPFDTNAFFQLREALLGPAEKTNQRHRVLDDCRQAVKVVHEHFDLMAELFKVKV